MILYILLVKSVLMETTDGVSRMRLVGGNLALDFVKHLVMPDGSRPRLDMWGHNPYGFHKPSLKGRPSPNGAVAFKDLRRLARKLDRNFRGQRSATLTVTIDKPFYAEGRSGETVLDTDSSPPHRRRGSWIAQRSRSWTGTAVRPQPRRRKRAPSLQ
jgi:hypothetical protein